LPDSRFFPSLYVNGLDSTADRSWHFHHGLVGFQFQHRLLSRDGVSDGDQHLHNISCGNTLPQLGQRKFECRHAHDPSLWALR
jgi:hypothetical protein